MNPNLLKAKVIAKGFNMQQFISKVNEKNHYMTIGTFYKKLNGTSEFTRKEIYRIKKVLNLSPQDIKAIFFEVNVA